MSDPGRLDTRLSLEAPVETSDGAGGVVRSYAAIATLWAELTPVGARERVVADAGGAAVTHRIRIRARGDVTMRHRFRLGARILRIVGLRDEGRGRQFLIVDAEERRE